MRCISPAQDCSMHINDTRDDFFRDGDMPKNKPTTQLNFLSTPDSFLRCTAPPWALRRATHGALCRVPCPPAAHGRGPTHPSQGRACAAWPRDPGDPSRAWHPVRPHPLPTRTAPLSPAWQEAGQGEGQQQWRMRNTAQGHVLRRGWQATTPAPLRRATSDLPANGEGKSWHKDLKKCPLPGSPARPHIPEGHSRAAKATSLLLGNVYKHRAVGALLAPVAGQRPTSWGEGRLPCLGALPAARTGALSMCGRGFQKEGGDEVGAVVPPRWGWGAAAPPRVQPPEGLVGGRGRPARAPCLRLFLKPSRGRVLVFERLHRVSILTCGIQAPQSVRL